MARWGAVQELPEPSRLSPPGDGAAGQSLCWPDNGPVEGHIWGGKASASQGAGWDLHFRETLRSALTYKQPPHMGSGLQPSSEPQINCEARKHLSSAA